VTTVIIRSCCPDEGPALLDLWHHADASARSPDALDKIDEVLRHPAAVVLVAVDNHLLVESIIGGWDAWRGKLHRLVVLPSYRRRGVARTLVAAPEQCLTGRGPCGSPRSSSMIIPGRWNSGTPSTSRTPA
jgi:ribosomal protein S18 acetylase RimI-like enzyme